MDIIILGISSLYHDSAAALIINGQIVAAAQEERFTRIKHDSSFPINSIKYVLKEWGGDPTLINLVSYYEKPFLKFERILENVHAFAPRGLKNYLNLIPSWLGFKLNIKKTIQYHLRGVGINKFKITYPEHHLSHAASSFYPSPFSEAAIITIDGVGEWATTTIMHGDGKSIRKLKEIKYPHSLGLLYSTFTSYCGFKVNDGEYKLMGLAPYSDPESDAVKGLILKIKDNIIKIFDDGSFTLNIDYFDFSSTKKMYQPKKWKELFGVSPNSDTTLEIDPIYINLSSAIQKVTEEIYIKLVHHAKTITGSKNLCLAGGVALNCVANGIIKKLGIFEQVWIQPAAGDAGSAIGCALATHHITLGEPREVLLKSDAMKNASLGPSYGNTEIKSSLDKLKAKYKIIEDRALLNKEVAQLLSTGNIVSWFQGRMEFGPRALGNRSILADSRVSSMQKVINKKIKFREQFRPFAPIVLEEDVESFFDFAGISPYMLFVSKVNSNRLIPLPDNFENFSIRDKLAFNKSELPSITHVNYSARVQTISKENNLNCYLLLKEFKRLTNCSVLINTSFNANNEPIVCSPEDAYKCFMKTDLDYLVIGNYLLNKKDQNLIR